MPEPVVNLGALVVGVAMLLMGGDLLVRGAAAIASRLGVAPLIIGLTVVAFGTSAPELALNITAAINDATDLSYGNIIGSNIANIGLILGLAAFFSPLHVHNPVLRRDLPIMLAATFAVVAMSYTPPDVVDAPRVAGLTRFDGAALLVGFGAFIAFMLYHGLKRDEIDPALAHDVEAVASQSRLPGMKLAVALFVLGLAILLTGGRLAEHGAVNLAEDLGLTQELIGLTIVALATSLPELATSIVAARKGQTDMAVGNVVGSNIFNILLVLGATAMVKPVALPVGAGDSLLIMCILSVLLLPMSATAKGRISRYEGALLLAIYFGFMGWRAWSVIGAL